MTDKQKVAFGVIGNSLEHFGLTPKECIAVLIRLTSLLKDALKETTKGGD